MVAVGSLTAHGRWVKLGIRPSIPYESLRHCTQMGSRRWEFYVLPGNFMVALKSHINPNRLLTIHCDTR